MKKVLLTTLFVLIMLVSLVGTAAAAPLSSGSVTLLSVEYVPGKGPVFTFHVSGHFSKSELTGFVHVEGGEDFEVNCTQVDEETVKCGTSKAAAGKSVSITWGGSTFWTSVPVAADPAAPEYCYSIWDYWEFTDYEWTDFGPHCQDAPAQFGDWITYTVPAPSGSEEAGEADVIFVDDENADFCWDYYAGAAYYYFWC